MNLPTENNTKIDYENSENESLEEKELIIYKTKNEGSINEEKTDDNINDELLVEKEGSSVDLNDNDKLYTYDLKKIKHLLALSNDDERFDVIKKRCLQVYAINLILYKQLSEQEQEYSPIKEMLIKLSILIEKLIKCKTNNNEKKRLYVKEKIRNKTKEKNPKKKNIRRAEELFAKKKHKVDKNIDINVTKTSKFSKK